MNELYQILKVKPNASSEEIHRAFRRLAKETHPDLNGNDNKKVERFNRIKEAYDILSNPEKRAKYDADQHKPVYPAGSNEEIRNWVLGLLNRLTRLKRRRRCYFFVGCVLAVFLGIIAETQHTSEMHRILSMIKMSDPKEAFLILGVLLGIVLLVLLADTFMITKIQLKLKKILKRKG